jgi:hypothetical protein
MPFDADARDMAPILRCSVARACAKHADDFMPRVASGACQRSVLATICCQRERALSARRAREDEVSRR